MPGRTECLRLRWMPLKTSQYWRYNLDTPTKEELKRAIGKFPSGRSPGEDAIPAEVIKYGNTTLLARNAAPQYMRDSSMVTQYKNKADQSICNNDQGITLLSVIRKLFVQIVLDTCRLKRLAERMYPESQCGFTSNSSTIYMIFSLHQQQGLEQQQPLYYIMALIRLTKAFDLESRDRLFKLLPVIACTPKL